jgi:MFS family permease
VLDIAMGFMFGGLGVLTVILANEQLGGGDEATGYLNAAIGVGGLIGALGSGALVLRRDLGPALVLGAVVIAIGLAGLGASEALAPAFIMMAVACAGNMVAEVVSVTVFQRVVPDAIRGRAFGVTATLSTLAYAAGSLAVPVLTAPLGVLPVLAAGGAAIAIAAVVAVLVVGPAMRRTPDAASEALRQVSALPLFVGVPPTALETAARRLRPIDVAAGTVVDREGEPASRFYLIERGEFAVDQLDAATGAARRLRVMGPDEVFGEIGLLSRVPRTATVTAAARTPPRPRGPDFLSWCRPARARLPAARPATRGARAGVGSRGRRGAGRVGWLTPGASCEDYPAGRGARIVHGAAVAEAVGRDPDHG